MHRKNNKYTLLRRGCGVLMCLLLSAAMLMPAAVPFDAFADTSLQQNMSADKQYTADTAVDTAENISADKAADKAAEEWPDTASAQPVNGDASQTEEEQSAGDTAAADDQIDQSAGSSADDTDKNNSSGLRVMSLFASGSVSEDASAGAAVAASKPKLAKTIKIDGMKISFSEKVIKSSYLGSDYIPKNVKIKAYKKKIKVSWSAPEKSDIDGYIIIRRNAEQPSGDNAVEEWTEVARVAGNKLSYTDKSASAADTEYRYIIGVYNSISGGTKISHMSDWASGVTTASSTANVYSVTHKNYAKTGALRIGKSIKISLGYPSSPFSKTLRWTSSNESKATVDETGRVTGVAKGTVTITGRMHTGETFSTTVRIIKAGTASAMISVMKSWMGYSYANGKHKGIVDIYNSKKPLPVGYTLKYNDAWCDASISAAAIRAGCVGIIGRECSVPRHITIFKSLGIWEEDGTIKPKAGDLIIYNWKDSTQPNNGNASHIGIVESVKNGTITAIEGNKGTGEVARRYIPVGWGFIRGYARPKYSK